MVDFPSLDTVHPQAAQMHAPMMHPQQGQIAHQAQPTRRLATIFGSFAGGSFFLLALILIGELAFKDDLRPSQLLGDFYGNASRAQIEASTDAQVRLASIQGRRRSWFCGAWAGYGFHEDGLKAGLAVAADFGIAAPWQPQPAALKAAA